MTDEKPSSTDRETARSSGRRWKLLGQILLVLAPITWVAGVIIENELNPRLRPQARVPFVSPLAVALAVAGAACYRKGKRLLVPVADDAMAHDPRPPVIYLRSFKDDPLAAKRVGGPRGFEQHVYSLGYLFSAPVTEEEGLAQVMNQVGPFVAIGRPGEALPELGAARMYVSDAEWQEKVGELMSRAQLVLLRAGRTPGFWWEVQHATKNVRPEKLLFLLPFANHKEYEPFRQEAQKHLPCTMPDYPTRPFLSERPVTSIQAVLYFDASWTPHIAPLMRSARGLDFPSKKFAKDLEEVLEPVAQNLGVAWEKPITTASEIPNWVGILIVVGVIIGLVILGIVLA